MHKKFTASEPVPASENCVDDVFDTFTALAAAESLAAQIYEFDAANTADPLSVTVAEPAERETPPLTAWGALIGDPEAE